MGHMLRVGPKGLICALLAAGAIGCGGDDATPESIVEPAPEVAWPNIGCDPLVPSFCGYPFPSNVHTLPDPDAPTELVVNILDEVVPASEEGVTSSLQGLVYIISTIIEVL